MKIISFAGSSEEPSPSHASKINELIDSLARECCTDRVALAFGGYWGAMKIAIDRALERGFTVLIFPPVEKEHFPFPERAIVVRTGASYRVRSVFLVRSGDILIALGGASGTIQEIITAYCEAKPILILRSGLDSDRLEALAPYIDRRELAELRFFDDPRDLAREVAKILGVR